MLPVVIAGARAVSGVKTAVRGASLAEKGALVARDSDRGITAVSRFARAQEGRTVQQGLLNQNNLSLPNNTGVGEDRGRQERRPGFQETYQNTQRDIRQGLEALTKETGVAFGPGDAELLVKDPPKKPGFPYVIFSIAVLKDISDALVLTGIGYALNVIFSFCMALILFLWLLSRFSGGWWKKGLLKKVFMRLGFAITLDAVPVVNLFPISSIFVLMAYYDETKIVKGLNQVLEGIRSGRIPL